MAEEKRIIDPGLGAQLRAIREEAELSQRELGQLLGITRPTVSRIESGTRSTGFATVRAWYRACGYELDAVQVGSPEQSLRIATALAELPPEYLDDVVQVIIAWPLASDRLRGRILGLLEALGDGSDGSNTNGQIPG